MYPHERSLVKEMKSKPFALIGVNSDKKLEDAKNAIAKNELDWRSFQDQPEGAQAKISDEWKLEGWPTIVVLDQDFKIRYRGMNGDEATRIARELVAGLEVTLRR
jgi:hypothetical protein